jgi:hypothetical protein
MWNRAIRPQILARLANGDFQVMTVWVNFFVTLARESERSRWSIAHFSHHIRGRTVAIGAFIATGKLKRSGSKFNH